MSNQPKLRLRGVSKKFVAPRTGHITLAVDDVSLDIASGEFISIVGPSGCGKSTVMNMIAGLDHATSDTSSTASVMCPVRGATNFLLTPRRRSLG